MRNSVEVSPRRNRQVAVGALAVQVDLILERAGHRAQGEALLRLVIRVAEDEHAVEIVIPVAGDLVKVALGHQRGLGEKIAALLLHILDPALEHLHDARALGQQHRKALTDAVDGGEVFELAAELVVVALLGLFDLGEVGVQLFLLRESDAVDALEHLAVRVAAPVGGVAGGQLDAVALDAAGGVEVRTGAEVGELALLVEADDGILGQVVDELHLVGLLPLLHELQCLLTGQLEALQLQLLLADLPHLRLDLGQILLCEGKGCVQIVVKPPSMDGPMASLTSGHRRLTACAMTWEQVCQYVLRYCGFSNENSLFSDMVFCLLN